MLASAASWQTISNMGLKSCAESHPAVSSTPAIAKIKSRGGELKHPCFKFVVGRENPVSEEHFQSIRSQWHIKQSNTEDIETQN